MGSMYSLHIDPHQAKESLERSSLCVDAINFAFSTFLRTYNILAQLSAITAPTLVIAGRHDWICPPEFSSEIAENIPHSKLLILENSGHSVRADQPKALLEAIANFLFPEGKFSSHI